MSWHSGPPVYMYSHLCTKFGRGSDRHDGYTVWHSTVPYWARQSDEEKWHMCPLSIDSIIRVRYLRVESRCILKGRHLVLVQSTAVTRDPVALSMKEMSWRPAAGDTGWNFQRQSNRISRNFRKFKGPVFWFNICIEIFRHCLKVA